MIGALVLPSVIPVTYSVRASCSLRGAEGWPESARRFNSCPTLGMFTAGNCTLVGPSESSVHFTACGAVKWTLVGPVAVECPLHRAHRGQRDTRAI